MPNPSCWPFQWWRGLPWGHCTAFLFRELWAQPATLWTGAVHAIGHAAVGGHGAFLLGYGNPWLRWEMIKPKMADLVGGIRKSVGIIFPGKKTCSKAPTRDFPIATLVLLGCAPWCSRNVLLHWPPARCECSISKPTAHPKSNHILIRQLELGFASEAPNKQTLRIFWWLLHSQCETNTQNILPFFGVVRECHGNFPQDFCWSVGFMSRRVAYLANRFSKVFTLASAFAWASRSSRSSSSFAAAEGSEDFLGAGRGGG